MEKKFYTDDFEQFLKETADEFRMYPSKRVWSSLYNNLHPSRKWPSLAVCLLFVFSMLYIGIAHKNEITGAQPDNKAANVIAANTINNSAESNSLFTTFTNHQPARQTVSSEPIAASNTTTSASDSRVDDPSLLKPLIIAANNASTNYRAVQIERNNPQSGRKVNNHTDLVAANTGSNLVAANANTSQELPANISNEEMVDGNIVKDKAALTKYLETINGADDHSIVIEARLPSSLTETIRKNKYTPEMEWIENYAFYNKPTTSFKSKLFTEYYITPSVGYRSLSKTVNYDFASRSSSLLGNGQNAVKQSPLIHHGAFNLEAGFAYVYNYTKWLKLRAGVQLNYTSYIIKADEMGHPSLTNILLDNQTGGIELSQHATRWANPSGKAPSDKLNSSTFQVSMPFGADVKVAGKHNLQWFVGASIQPTYVIFGNAYLISADLKNYVYDSKFIRKWNLNSSLETYVSYKTKKGITFNVGPQFRYQFFSTYRKNYTYDEKLFNAGLKFGMIKNL